MNQKGFTKRFLKLMSQMEAACCQGNNNLFSIATEDTASVNLSGDGKVDNPLIADVIISANIGNTITMEADGLFAAGGVTPVNGLREIALGTIGIGGEITEFTQLDMDTGEVFQFKARSTIGTSGSFDIYRQGSNLELNYLSTTNGANRSQFYMADSTAIIGLINVYASFDSSGILFDTEAGDVITFNTDVLDIKNSSGGTQFAKFSSLVGTPEIQSFGTIKTAQPSVNGQGRWKLGKLVVGATALDATQYLEVEVDGVVYKIALST
jgi:hypothetical protein